MLHHSRGFIDSVEADRRAEAARRRPPAVAGELERMVMAAAAGDRTALSALVERFAARVRAVACVHRLAAHDVDDVMQTTWLRLVEHVDAVRDPTAIGAWLETTARRESLRVLKATTRERPTDDQLALDAPAQPVDEQRLATAERCAAVAAAVEQLTGRQRELLLMLLADPPPSYAEISRALGMPVGSIGPTRARSLARLRENQDLRRMADTVGEHGI
jgi:RNA polymerase sigma factor (sigma-70 family)